MKQFPRKLKRNRVQLLVEALETRCLLCVTVGPDGKVIPDADGDYTVGSPGINDPGIVQHDGPTGGGGSGPAGTIPALSSRPGAPANLYLNFAGDNVPSWLGYSPGVVPAFTGTTTTVAEIWQSVAENYSPFNINVTTVQPTSGEVSQIDIGGAGAWTGGTYGGIGQVGGMSSSSPSNPVRGFVFPDNLGGGYYWYVADGCTHESGHNMGLQHQSSWSGSTKTAEYQTGPGDGTAPTMGSSYAATRSMWWYGLNTNDVYQNDMDVISSNPFGYAPLATGTTAASAHPLTVSGTSLSATGDLESMTENDYWSFSTAGGAVSFTVSAPYSTYLSATFGNLHPKMEITDSSGSVIVGWQDSDSASLSWSGSLAAGSYRIVVSSHGISSSATANNFGFDVGDYTISGTTSATSAPPTGLTAQAADSQVVLGWNPSSGATSYNIYRSTISGGETLYATGVASTSFPDTGLTNGTTYYYEVSAVGSFGESGLSSQVMATPDQPPTVLQSASADSNPVTGISTSLSVLGADGAGEGTLTYTWIVSSKPAGATNPTFSFGSGIANGSNGAKNVTATFSSAGSYTFQVTITNLSSMTAASSVGVTVNQTETSITISPSSASVTEGNSKQFTATALDQFGLSLVNQPTFTWTVDAGGAGGTIGANSGLYTAPITATNGMDTVRATDAGKGLSGSAAISVLDLPAAPTNLVATGISTSQISLTWTDNGTNETSYSVERSSNGTTWSVIATLAANSTSYANTKLQSGATYYYRVREFVGTLASPYSNIASAVATYGAPTAPVSLVANGISPSQINLTWADTASNATAYEVMRSTDGNSWSVIVNNLGATATSYSDTRSLAAGTTYYYEVLALNHTTLSGPSNVANAATLPAAPGQPSNLSAVGTYNSANPSLGAINLVWQDKASTETSYNVERSLNGTTWIVIATLPANSSSYADTGLTLGTKYYYRVRCFNGPSASPYSSVVNTLATPAVPATPATLAGTAVSSSQINLVWQDKASNETSYSVERSLNGSTWTVIATLPANSASYPDSGLSAATKYYYRVRCFDGPTLASSYTSTVRVTTLAAGHGPSLPGDNGGPGPDASVGSKAAVIATSSQGGGSSIDPTPANSPNADNDRPANPDAFWLAVGGSPAGLNFVMDGEGDAYTLARIDATFSAIWWSNGTFAGYDLNNNDQATVDFV